MGLAALLTLGFVIGEAIAGYFSHSLALFSDAGHNFADAAALGFSWYAIWVARKPAHPGMTYGYHRVAILAALLNAVSLVIIALLILWQAIERLHHPEIVHGWLMIVVAAVAIGLNLLIGFWLHAGSKHDINVRSAYVHMIGDAISAMGVVIAGIIVVISGWQLADPIVSFVIAGLILWSCWGVLRESVSVLLEATPLNIDMGAVENCIRQVRGVLNVHDLHVWTVGPGAIACSCHIMVGEQSIRDGQQILRCVVKELEHHHAINHTTVQVEVEGHESNEMYCTMRVNDDATHAGHQH
jgi:cobalt-zinc-cadmium efflux system protein